MWDWVTYDLRHHAEMSGLSGSQLAKIIGKSRPHASNILAGLRTLQDEDASKIDKRFGTGDRYRLMLHWARRGHDPSWFGQYLQYEGKSQSIETFQAVAVPGLLQTPEYARELISAVGTSTDVAADVAQRMERTKILGRSGPPFLWALITENVIDWPIGGPEVMRKQLAHLLELSESPNIGLRVVERTAGAHAGIEGSFSLLSGGFGAVAYTDSPGAGRLVTSSTEVRSYEVRYNRISQAASPERATRDLIHRAMEEL